MTKTSHSLLSAVAFLALPLASVAKADTPRAGSNELRIEGSYFIPGIGLTGLAHSSESSGNTTVNQTIAGAGFAYGRFLTDNVEIGSSVNLIYVGGAESSTSSGSTSSISSTTGFGMSPFLRFFAMVQERVGLFGGVAGGLQVLSPSGAGRSDQTVWNVGVDAGAEFFIGDSWSLRIGPTYRYIHENVENSSLTASGHVYGASWGLAGYF